MQSKKLFLAIMILFTLTSFPFINTVGASSELWSQTYGGTAGETAYSVVETSDGGFVLVGGTDSFGAGMDDFWLVKIDGDGTMEWNRMYGGTSDERAYSLVETSDEGFALAGQTYSFDVGQGDFWLVKTDAYGNMEWNQTYGGKGIDIVHSLVEVSAGGFALAGKTSSLGAGGGDFCFVKTDDYGIIPEFPFWAILPLLLMATLVVMFYKHRLPKTSSN